MEAPRNSLLAYGFGKAERLAQQWMSAQWWAQAWTRPTWLTHRRTIGRSDPLGAKWSELEGWLEERRKAVLKRPWPRAISPSSVRRGLVRLHSPRQTCPSPPLLVISEHPSIVRLLTGSCSSAECGSVYIPRPPDKPSPFSRS